MSTSGRWEDRVSLSPIFWIWFLDICPRPQQIFWASHCRGVSSQHVEFSFGRVPEKKPGALKLSGNGEELSASCRAEWDSWLVNWLDVVTYDSNIIFFCRKYGHNSGFWTYSWSKHATKTSFGQVPIFTTRSPERAGEPCVLARDRLGQSYGYFFSFFLPTKVWKRWRSTQLSSIHRSIVYVRICQCIETP